MQSGRDVDMIKKFLAMLMTGFVMGWTVQGWHKDARNAHDAAQWAEERIALADATADAQRAAMEKQKRLYEAINEVTNEANKKMRRVVANERASADKRVREQAIVFARCRRGVACTTDVAQPGAADADPAGVLAKLLGELD